jgi:hypothetical protein
LRLEGIDHSPLRVERLGEVGDVILMMNILYWSQKTLEVLMIILSLFELNYLLALHAGFMTGGSAGYNHGGHGATNIGGVPHEHHTDYGHHTDMKIPRGHVAHPVV